MGMMDQGGTDWGSLAAMLSAVLTKNPGMLMQYAQLRSGDNLRRAEAERISEQTAALRRAAAQEERDRSMLAEAPSFGSPTAPNMAPTPENAAQLKRPSPFEQSSKMVEYLRGKGVSPQYMKPYIEQMEKFRPKAKADQQVVKMPDGSLGLINIMDDGTSQVVPYTPAEEQKSADTGQATQLYGKFSGLPGQRFQNTVSPNTAFTGGVTMRGQDLTDARAREMNAINREGQQSQIVNDPNLGIQIVNKANKTATPAVSAATGQQLPSENQAKRAAGAQNVMGLLADAEKHLPDATNSIPGVAYDYGMRGFGHATEGAKATASLQAIEGALLSQMPRMEGPQSNYDVQNYKRAAGQIGDPTLPRETRQAAIDTIRTIQARYANGPTGGNRRYNPQTGKIE